MATTGKHLEWYRVADLDELPEGRVKTVTPGTHSMALTYISGEFTAMDNRCPHQGGPWGEGSIEAGENGQCWLRCPWHGWDFDPQTGRSPGGHEDSEQTLYTVEIREDGIYVGREAEPPHATTVTDVMAETMVHWRGHDRVRHGRARIWALVRSRRSTWPPHSHPSPGSRRRCCTPQSTRS